MFSHLKSHSRRFDIRKSRPDSYQNWWSDLRERGAVPSLLIAGGFWLAVTCILVLMREEVVSYRPGQHIAYDITARVDFRYTDKDQLLHSQAQARDSEPRIYKHTDNDFWKTMQDELLTLPDRVHGNHVNELDSSLKDILDSGALTALEQCRLGPERARYEDNVRQFLAYTKEHLLTEGEPLVILPQDQRLADVGRHVILQPAPPNAENPGSSPIEKSRDVDVMRSTYSTELPDSVRVRLEDYARAFDINLGPKIAALTFTQLSHNPTHVIDPSATAAAQNAAADRVPREAAEVPYHRNTPIVPHGVINDKDWQVLRAENEAYLHELAESGDGAILGRWISGLWEMRLGIAMMTLIITIVLSAYVARYQPRITRNHVRAIAMAALLFLMLLISELAGIGTSALYLSGIAPTMVAAIILTIAYDQRFAIGIGSIQALLVTVALNQGMGFFLILWVGVLTACYLLDDIRTRSKLIEVGGATAIAMMIVTAAVGALAMEPARFIGYDCLYAGAAGLAAGFIVLGILPVIEHYFRITTSMTLLELADASQPLLRRLALEAPGTYNHSLQVATLSETAADAIGANSLACRVGSYYHDIGKIHKADYFVENQLGGPSRHLNLSPNVSLLIIVGHVKDGVEMAKEYNLPTSLIPYITQHHGTTLVEYFYHAAREQQESQQPGQPAISDTQYRYPGPKPRSKETAIVMLSDAVESACRAMPEPTASRIEALVHDLAMKRLMDNQFDECDLTLRDLDRIERSLSKTLLGIYHGRIAYPSTSTLQATPTATTTDPSAVKTA